MTGVRINLNNMPQLRLYVVGSKIANPVSGRIETEIFLLTVIAIFTLVRKDSMHTDTEPSFPDS